VRLSEALERIAGALDTVRRIATSLRPAVLDDIGLVAAVEWQAQQFAKRTGVRTTVELPSEDPPLASDARTTVFRIVQEALTNVARHADARSVHVAITVRADSVRVSVRDDGRGISDGELTDRRSLGLLGLRERAIAAGGVLTVRGRPRRGTTVTLTLATAAHES
jgi:signal transduction histidine kinase